MDILDLIDRDTQKIKQLFVILDRFNRDALYRQCGIELDFKKEADLFCSTLNQVMCPAHLECKMNFSEYSAGIEKGDPPHLQTNNSKGAKVKSTLLFFAVSQPIPQDVTERKCLNKIIEALVEKCPQVTFSHKKHCFAPTPLHLMIVKEANSKKEKEFKHKLLEKMLAAEDRYHLLGSIVLSCTMSRGSISGGKSLLNIAARTLDIETIKLLLKYGASYNSCNDQGDNMYHSLVRYALICPEKESQIKSTMMSIATFLLSKGHTINTYTPRILKLFPDHLWTMKNVEGLTPLQLAAKLGRFELFEYITKQRIYQVNDGDRGSLDDVAYDVTEIDTVPVTDAIYDFNSVLHLLQHQSSDELTLRFVGLNVVGKTISAKWEQYKLKYLVWAILHFVMMCLYSGHAVIRSRRDNPISKAKSTWPNFNDVTFVVTSGIITTLYAIFCVLSQCGVGIHYGLKHRGIRYFWRHRDLVIFFSYGHIILLLVLGMIIDFILMFTPSECQNCVLPFAVIIGWYVMIYFLRVVEQFSFFSVLIKNVTSDLIQFGVVMSFLLIGFSTAMFVAMQGAEGISESHFHNVGKTFVKMFTVMVGIGDIDVLFNARNPVLAVLVFVLFVLMTTILLLNALIAIMSNTCSVFTTSTSSKAYVRLQRMHAVLNLESMLPKRLLSPAAEEVKRLWPDHVDDALIEVPRRIFLLLPDDDKQSTPYSSENVTHDQPAQFHDNSETRT